MSTEKEVYEKHIDLLGFKAKDVITGFEGVISSVTFDLYGCLQVIITPPAKDGETKSGCWFDVTRVEILSKKPVMPRPNFLKGYVAEGKKGPAEKPMMSSKV